MAAPKKLKMVHLVCEHLKGRYPKLKSTNFPMGLVFRQGILEIPETDFNELQENKETAFMFQRYRQMGEIRVLGIDTNRVPKVDKVKVISGRALSTAEAGGEPTVRESRVDEFPADTSKQVSGKAGIELVEG